MFGLFTKTEMTATSRSERFIEEFESGKNMRHGIANVLKHLAYAFGDGEAVPISLIEEIVPELLERALAGDGDAARQFLQEVGMIDEEGNLTAPYRPEDLVE
jgi:hypothetical protein